MDAVASDPDPGVHPPATTPAVTFDSGGETLQGVLHVPAGPGPHPVVLVLHGFPGYERNFDLAQALRRAGYASLVFHYRGAWGVGGSWSANHVLEDAAEVATAIGDPELVAAHRLDPERIAVVGHSFGGFVALMTAAAIPSIVAVGSVAGFDAGSAALACRADPELRARWVAAFDEWRRPLRGTSGEELMAELEAAGEAWSLAGLAPRLAGRPVLLIGTGRDVDTPAEEHHDPVVRAYREHPVTGLEEHVFQTDHALSDHRIALARTVIDFLDRHVRSARG